MTRSFVLLAALLPGGLQSQTPPVTPAVHHEANFDSERAKANELFLAQKYLEALPLYEDLCRQDPTIAVFAERHGTALLKKSSTLADPGERTRMHQDAVAEIRRAQKLGDNSNLVQAVLGDESKNFLNAVITNIPLTVGYTNHGTPEAQAAFQQAEAAFGRNDWTTAAGLYTKAASIDPTWYAPPLCAGDTYFRLNDLPNASLWFTKAIAIDPDRETAYRYWGDALFHAGDLNGAREKFVQAIVAEPYSKAALIGLAQWAQKTGHQIVKPDITRPNFNLENGKLKIDPDLAASTQDGRSSWIIYQQYRVDHGAGTLNQWIVGGGFDASANLTPKGYQHTIAEEHAALRAMLDDINAKLSSGTLIETNLDPSLRNIRNLEKANALGAWIAIDAADAGIRSDYPEYRAHHRKHLVEYVDGYLVH